MQFETIEIEKFPCWALYYLEYGEDESLDYESTKMIENFIEKHEILASTICSAVEGTENEFTAYPAFGGGCATVTLRIQKPVKEEK